jgi:hypothetical protein
VNTRIHPLADSIAVYDLPMMLLPLVMSPMP